MTRVLSSRHIAVIIQLSTLIYFTIDNHVSLRPWNNLKTSQWKSTVLQWLLWSEGLIAFWNNWRAGMFIGTMWIWIFLILQGIQWWLPYLVGKTFLHDDFSWFYEGGYDSTLQLVHRRQDRPTPDAQHMALQFLTFISGLFSTIVLWKSMR